MKPVLLTSTDCGCCKNYTETVKNILPDIAVIHASSALGKKLMFEYHIIGLPTIIYENHVYTGNYRKSVLETIIKKKQDKNEN